MSQPKLTQPHNRFYAETEQILGAFRAPLSAGTRFETSCSAIHPYGQEMCVLRLHDAWARFCRELVIMSAGDRPITLTGAFVPRAPHVRNRADVIPQLLKGYPTKSGKSKWGPRWADPAECIEAARLLGISNFSNVSGSIGAATIGTAPSPIEYLRRVRNFFAHRTEETAGHVRKVALALNLPINYGAMQIINNVVPPGHALLALWIYQLRTIALSAIR